MNAVSTLNAKLTSLAYRRYVLAIMVAVYTLNLLDRGLMGLLLQPIKEELHLSDTQLGLLTGIAFGLFYATLGVPIARWADRGNRVTIASLSIALWSLTVMICLFVVNYPQLLVARMAAAVGESGCKPPTYSLVGDYFPKPAERIRAMSIYWVSGGLAILISSVVGGWLNELYGWRMTFFLMGTPGLLLAVLVKLTVLEPRMHTNGTQVQEPPQPPLKEVLSTLWHRRSCRHLASALILLFFLTFGINSWTAAFLMRSLNMGTAELGAWLGPLSSVGAIGGVLLGGYAATRWFADSEQSQMRMSAVAVAASLPCYLVFLTVPHKYVALIMQLPIMLVLNFCVAPTYALMQRVVRDETRATTMAVIMLLYNLIGMGVGPLAVGMLSDFLVPLAGRDSLRYAMLIMTVVALWSAYHFWCVGRTVKNDLSLVADRRYLAVSLSHSHGVSGLRHES